jgi:hypothetical protein
MLGREPHRLEVVHPVIIEELLSLAAGRKTVAVTTIIEMPASLHAEGRSSPYLVELSHSPLWELNPMSRGGERGGCRVYLFLLPTGEAGIVNGEVKKPDAKASQSTLSVGLRMMKAYNEGTPVFEEAR